MVVPTSQFVPNGDKAAPRGNVYALHQATFILSRVEELTTVTVEDPPVHDGANPSSTTPAPCARLARILTHCFRRVYNEPMKLHLAPVPQSIDVSGGTHTLGPGCVIMLHGEARGEIIAARGLQAAIEQYAGVRWEIRAGTSVAESEGVVAAIDNRIDKREGYHLTIGEERIGIVARDGAGLAHGFSTLVQLVRQCGRRLPRLHIEDHPDFAHRGVMLDISRDKLPTMNTLLGLVDRLSEWKINQFQLYMEHTFAYQRHRAVWKDASPLTGEDVLALDAYCRERHIELVPNQNSFGHMERWLIHKPYTELAEVPGGVALPHAAMLLTKRKRFSTTLNPGDKRSLDLMRGLYAELLPHFSSANFNVGCDETWELGQGASKKAVAERGTGRVYLDWLMQLHALCEEQGRRMMFWGDIIKQHPELIGEIPRDVTALEWGYEHDHPYDTDAKAFRRAGLPFYVCPGAGGWNSFVGRTDNVVANITNATTNGLKHKASGVLTTEWGDGGHMQPAPVPWLGFMFGASMSWSTKASASMDLVRALSLHAFDDPSGETGRIAYDLGNAYQINGAKTRNGSLLNQLYFLPLDNDWPMQRVRPGGFEETSDALAALSARLDAAKMRRPDAQAIVDEYRGAVEMADIGAATGAAKYARAQGASAAKLRPQWRRIARRLEAVVPAYERAWLARNRAGGLGDSVWRIRELATRLRVARG